ncbi:MAG: hypothetical protein IPF77_11030, partial [Gemmatimonadetes bacterium]|nr:hypothetical protein [Gemmatimonadota bacterium]
MEHPRLASRGRWPGQGAEPRSPPELWRGRLGPIATTSRHPPGPCTPCTIPVHTLDGAPTTLAPYRGKVLLIVNVASQCGFTPQYAGLEALHRAHQQRGLAVLGFPCDQ